MKQESTLYERFTEQLQLINKSGTLPPSIAVNREEACFEGQEAKRNVSFLHVREEGPDAWGALINRNANACFRFRVHGKLHDWHVVKASEGIWVECLGTEVELIYVDPKTDKLVFETFVSISW